MTTPTVSAIIPSYNRLATLPRAIDSVLGQTRAALELLIVDDGSVDGTTAWLKQHLAGHPRVRLFRQANRGVSAARNLAIAHARGDWLAFLDSDDCWYPQKLERQTDALMAATARGHAYRWCHCDEDWIRKGRFVNPRKRHRKPGGTIFDHCLPLCCVSPSAALVERRLLQDTGWFDESLPACEDYDLWLRIACQEPILYIDERLLEKTGGHDDQLSRRYPAMDYFRLQSIDRLLRFNSLSDSQRALALRRFRERFAIYAQGAVKRGRQAQIDALTQHYRAWLQN